METATRCGKAALEALLKNGLAGRELIAVSNRQPYSHNTHAADGSVQVTSAPGGLVTALEPMLIACSGVWIAHGDGSADRRHVDAEDRVRVPPQHPEYTLRRVWLAAEEHGRYYLGFANSGLWPLFHETSVMPRFDAQDWESYNAVNVRFAQAVTQEVATDCPIVMVQDYHLALLPYLIRSSMPRATVVLFWHIPWPNPRRLDLCPWREAIIKGMLAADLIGFNTRGYCRHFLQSVAAAAPNADVPRVTAYPESVEWSPAWMKDVPSIAACRAQTQHDYGIAPGTVIGLGVDRWDFTKGIPERLLALERFLESYTEQHGHVVFLQIAAPSRSVIPEYAALQSRTLQLVNRINARFGSRLWTPIIFVAAPRGKREIYRLYRSARFMLVTSLHDGMNLVAKEFVSARDDNDGVLILSKFAGAACELKDALQVDPTNRQEMVGAIRRALAMPSRERTNRMAALRSVVERNDVHRWASRILQDAAEVKRAPLS